MKAKPFLVVPLMGLVFAGVFTGCERRATELSDARFYGSFVNREGGLSVAFDRFQFDGTNHARRSINSNPDSILNVNTFDLEIELGTGARHGQFRYRVRALDGGWSHPLEWRQFRFSSDGQEFHVNEGGSWIVYTLEVPRTTQYTDEGLEFVPHDEGYRVRGFRRGTDVLAERTVIIPDVHNGLPVVSIGSMAFSTRNLISITIPDSVTEIASSAFRGNRLTSVTIPDSVTYIGDSAFSQNRLTGINIPDGITRIGRSVFSNNQLTSVAIPYGVTHIGGMAFWGNQLTSVTIPNSVTSIDMSAFVGNQLTTVTIPGHTWVSSEAFDPEVTIIRN